MQIVAGLQHPHASGIVHRDVVLENILTKDTLLEHVALADLGCACVLQHELNTNLVGEEPVGHTSCRPLNDTHLSFKYDIFGLAGIGRSLTYFCFVAFCFACNTKLRI